MHLQTLMAAGFKGIRHNSLQQDDMHNGDHVETLLKLTPEKTEPHFDPKRSIHLIMTRIGVKFTQLLSMSDSLKKCGESIDMLQKSTDEEMMNKSWKHLSYMAKILEVLMLTQDDTEPLEQGCQNDVECDDERVALANLIANLKLDVDENKKIQKQLKKENATLTQELTECKSILAETSRIRRI
ncbi:hypothetical protein Tco_0451675 [Tanacetum coccineum]